MDNKPIGNVPFSFGELGSDIGNGVAKPLSELSGDKGFLDPEIGRVTSGAEPTGNAVAGDNSGTPGTGPAANTTRRRGRPPGPAKSADAKQTPKEPPRAVDISGLDKILFSIHAMGAAMLSVPELEITEAEAKKLDKAIQGVNDQFKMTLDPKKAALIDLGTTVGVIYGPRCVSLYMRKKMEHAANPKPQRVTPEEPLSVVTPSRDASSLTVPFNPANIKLN